MRNTAAHLLPLYPGWIKHVHTAHFQSKSLEHARADAATGSPFYRATATEHPRHHPVKFSQRSVETVAGDMHVFSFVLCLQ
jgi:hypothetical protein